MKIENLRFCSKVIALAIYVGALPFLFCASAYAQENAGVKEETREKVDLWEDYRKPVGLTYGVQARIQTSYLWRGLYCGGPNIQASANVGYGGLYFDAWWNIGVSDWTFHKFQPELDLTLGFNRWGLNIYALYIHNFDTPFFDFGNSPDRTNRLELNAMYTLSSKIPLTFRWATRIAASDCYINASGEIVRAYSSYAEVSYTQQLRDGWSLYGAIGMTPWKGCYNANGAALQNIEVRVRKDWELDHRCGLMVQGQVCVNPTAPVDVLLTNIAFGVYLR